MRQLVADFRAWIRDNPWLVSLIVFTLAVIPGFLRMEYINEKTQTQADQNSGLIICLTEYAIDMTDALQDRDAVAVLARGASVDLWKKFRELLVEQPADGRAQFLKALRVYLRTLSAVSRTADINPYPDLGACLRSAGIEVSAMGDLLLTASPQRSYCLGKRVTIRGTERSDLIQGTDQADVIRTYGGVDLISAGAGNDRICAGSGVDIVNGGRGYDRVNCGWGWDIAQAAEYRRSCEN